MSVKTVMVCSKFSPTCVQTLETLKQKNIATDPFIKLLWIDHPNMRNLIKTSGLVKSVPAIIVHDEARDLSIVYEGDKFKEYIGTFIQNHSNTPQAHPVGHTTAQARPNPFVTSAAPVMNAGLFHAQNQVMLDHQNAQQTMAQAVQDLSTHQVAVQARTPQQMQTQQEGIKDNINRHIFGANGLVPESRSGYLEAIQAQAEKANAQFQAQQDQNRARLDAERAAALLSLPTASKENPVQAHREAMQQQHQAKQAEHDKLQHMLLIDKLRNDPSNHGLSDAEFEQLATMEELQIKYRELERLQQHEQSMMQLRQSTDSSGVSALETQKQAIIAQLRGMPSIPLKDRQVMELRQQQQQAQEQSLKSQMNHEAQKPYFQAMQKKYEIEREAQRLQEELNRTPNSPELMQQLQILQHLYTQVNAQLQPPSAPVAAPAELPPVHSSVPQQLQQEQQVTQLELQKEQERHQRAEGFTNLLDLGIDTGEESLYDHQQAMRPRGTDVHQSEEQVKQNMQVSKRNTLNQQVRAMSNNREFRPQKGVGHEQMAKTSLTVIEQPHEEVTSLDRIGDVDHTMLSIPPSESLDIIDDFGDVIDDAPEPEPARPQIKKKSSIVDRAREMEKGRM